MLLGNRYNNVFQAELVEVLTGIKQGNYTNFARDNELILEDFKGPLRKNFQFL